MGTALPGAIKIACTFMILSVLAGAQELTQAQQTLLGQQVAEMFQVGYARGPKAYADVQRLYESLNKTPSNDPRVDYAHGLVLWRLLKNKEAQAEFTVATKRKGTPYWPAWQGLIWTHFVAKDYDAGYARLLEFTRLVIKSDEVTAQERDDQVYWIGRVMAALYLTIESNQGRETWLQTEKKLTDLLGPDLTDDYNSGKSTVNARHSDIEDDIRQTREKGQKQQAELLEKKQSRVQKNLEDVKEKRENLKKTAEEMKEALAEQTAAYQKQMARLEKDYGFVERRSAALTSSMAALDQEIAILQQRKKNSNNNTANQIDQAIANIQSQRFAYNAELAKSMTAADQISASAQRLTQERAEFLEQYQNVTGEIVQQDAGAEKWKERNLKQAAQLKKAQANPKPVVPAGKIQLAKTFRTYVDLDLYAERSKVLESFGVVSLGK
ncbi:MAG: hypothetical protein WCH39_25125 [Schlesneria sp.]